MEQNNNQMPAEPVEAQVVEQPQPNVQQPVVNNSGNKTNLKLPMILGGVLLALAVIGLIVWYTMFNVTKDDYKKADTAVKDMKTVYTDAGDKLNDYMNELGSSYSSDSDINKAKDDFNKLYSEYKTKATALKDQKALRDGDVKKSYDEFEAQNKKFTEAVDGVLAIAPTLRDAKDGCASRVISSTLSTATPETLVNKYDEAIKDCKTAVVKLSESSVAPISEYGKKAVKGIEKMRTYVEKMQSAAKDGNRSEFQSAYYDMMDDDDVKAMSESGMDEFDKHMKGAEVKDKLNSFADLVGKKAA